MGSKARALPGSLYELGKAIKTKLEQNEKNKEIRCEGEKTEEEAVKGKENYKCSLVQCLPVMCTPLV